MGPLTPQSRTREIFRFQMSLISSDQTQYWLTLSSADVNLPLIFIIRDNFLPLALIQLCQIEFILHKTENILSEPTTPTPLKSSELTERSTLNKLKYNFTKYKHYFKLK